MLIVTTTVTIHFNKITNRLEIVDDNDNRILLVNGAVLNETHDRYMFYITYGNRIYMVGLFYKHTVKTIGLSVR